MKTQAFLFDYGGTLDTAARHWFYVLYEGFLHAGAELRDEDFRPAYVYAERALARHPYIRPTDNFLDLLRKKTQLETEYLVHHGLLPAHDAASCARLSDQAALYCDSYARRHAAASARVLEQLSNRPLIIVSNFYGNLQTILRTYGLMPYVNEVVESAVVGVRKPDPAIFRMGVERAGCSPSACTVVGDSFTKDILPGREAGCRTVWFKGEEWEDVVRDETIPDFVITDLPQLLDLPCV